MTCPDCERNRHMFDIVVNEQRYTPKFGDRVLDLGAWYGHFTFYCASRGTIVKAYEPLPEVFADFAHNLSKQPWAQNVTAINKAISSHDHRRELFVDPNDRASSFFRPGRPIIVDVETLSEALEDKTWQCVKVDIEGAEYELLMHASGEELNRISYLTVELHNDVLMEEQHDALIRRMSAVFEYI